MKSMLALVALCLLVAARADIDVGPGPNRQRPSGSVKHVLQPVGSSPPTTTASSSVLPLYPYSASSLPPIAEVRRFWQAIEALTVPLSPSNSAVLEARLDVFEAHAKKIGWTAITGMSLEQWQEANEQKVVRPQSPTSTSGAAGAQAQQLSQLIRAAYTLTEQRACVAAAASVQTELRRLLSDNKQSVVCGLSAAALALTKQSPRPSSSAFAIKIIRPTGTATIPPSVATRLQQIATEVFKSLALSSSVPTVVTSVESTRPEYRWFNNRIGEKLLSQASGPGTLGLIYRNAQGSYYSVTAHHVACLRTSNPEVYHTSRMCLKKGVYDDNGSGTRLIAVGTVAWTEWTAWDPVGAVRDLSFVKMRFWTVKPSLSCRFKILPNHVPGQRVMKIGASTGLTFGVYDAYDVVRELHAVASLPGGRFTNGGDSGAVYLAQAPGAGVADWSPFAVHSMGTVNEGVRGALGVPLARALTVAQATIGQVTICTP